MTVSSRHFFGPGDLEWFRPRKLRLFRMQFTYEALCTGYDKTRNPVPKDIRASSGPDSQIRNLVFGLYVLYIILILIRSMRAVISKVICFPPSPKSSV